jgi:flagellar hook-associated protein 2
MASIQSLGIGSDLLTSKLLEDILAAERQGADLRLEANQLETEAKISAYGEVKSALSSMSSSISALNLSTTLTATQAVATDPSILSATTTSITSPGSYSIEVTQLAQAHSLASKRFDSVTDTIGVGVLRIGFGETQYNGSGDYTGFVEGENPAKSIVINDGSMAGVRDAINEADAGVTATIVNDGVGYRLLLTVDEAGSGNSLEVTALSGVGLDQLEYNLTNHDANDNLEELVQATSSNLSVNGLNIVADSNSVIGVIPGVTLNLSKTNTGEVTTLSLTRDTSKSTEKIQSFVDSYNELRDIMDTHTGYDAERKEAGLLLGDATLRSVFNQVRSVLGQVVPGLENSRYRTLSEVGVSLNQFDNFKLSFDANKLEKALNENADNVTALFATQGTASDANVEFLNSGSDTKAGEYDLVITQLATKGAYSGQSVDALDFASPVVINNENDSLGVKVDGHFASVSLSAGSYSSGAQLALEIQSQINGHDSISSKGSSVQVDYNSAQKRFDITSNKYGSSSSVSFLSVDTNTANSIGFAPPGLGTFNGLELTSLGNKSFSGKGSSTLPAFRTVAETEGINFATSNATFSLDVGGGAVAVTVNQNAGGLDLNGDFIYGDRNDTVQAVQNALDATSLNGLVVAAFNDDNKLVFTTTAIGSTESIEITSVGTNASDVVLGLYSSPAQVNGDDAGVEIGANTTFKVEVNGVVSSDVTVPQGTYLTGDALAAAVQTAINADAGLLASAVGAESVSGSRDISALLDFTSAPSGFTLNLNGVETDILVNANVGSTNLESIQDALDTTLGNNVVTASIGAGNGVVFTTVATGPSQSISVTSSGAGAQTTAGSQTLTGIDFTSNNADFDLIVDGITLNVNVNGDGTVGSNDATSTLSVIQSAIDTAAIASGSFAAGDIIAKLNGSDQLSFETRSKNGVKTASTFGATSSVELANVVVASGSDTLLGLVGSVGSVTNGFDSLGHSNEVNYGNDAVSSVTYELDAVSGLGKLNISAGNNNNISFSDVSGVGKISLGLHAPDGSENNVVKGKDIAGTINGIEGVGTGQVLKAQSGNQGATNGYFLNTKSLDFTSAVIIDSGASEPNNKFTVEVDGEEQLVTIPDNTYATGDELAEAIEKAINENNVYEGKNISVTVDYEDDVTSVNFGHIGIISNAVGLNSSVKITDAPEGISTTLGFSKGLGLGKEGSAQVGNVDPANGINIKVAGGVIGDRGSVSFVSGIADQLTDLLKFMLQTGGTLDNKQNLLDDQLESLSEEGLALDARFAAKEARLASQFAFNDALIASLNTTQDFLTQQFEALASIYTNK